MSQLLWERIRVYVFVHAGVYLYIYMHVCDAVYMEYRRQPQVTFFRSHPARNTSLAKNSLIWLSLVGL